MSSCHIFCLSRFSCSVLKNLTFVIFTALIFIGLSACATKPSASPLRIESHPKAITVPYSVSEAGHLIVDVAVNGRTAKPFIIDSGANISAVYEDYLQDFGLTNTGKTANVSGLVASAVRPITGRAELQVGSKIFQPNRIVILETPPNTNNVVGLLGVDILSDYMILFNKETLTATLIPSADIDRNNFSGWHTITLRNRVGFLPDKGLYFTTIILKGKPAPVLIDTGSSLNFINWDLATQDESIKKLQTSLKKAIRLQGAIDTIPLQLRAVFYDVQLGRKRWAEVDVVVLEFDTLSEIAPVDGPMMLAGVGFFSPSTFAFDFGGNALYIHKDKLADSSREIQGDIVDVRHRASRLSK